MKRFALAFAAIALCVCAQAATRHVYVDYANEDTFTVSLANQSTDTIVFHVLNDGALLSTSGYTPLLYLSPDKVFGSSQLTVSTGTLSGANATFAATNSVITSGKDGWYMQLVYRSGSGSPSSPYVYHYPINGKLKVDGTPVTRSGDPVVMDSFGYAGTLSVTNGQTVAPTLPLYVVTGYGGADDTTNTITLANAVDGQSLTLIVDGASSNLITIADSGIAMLSGAWLGDNNDSITLVGVGTNWVETAESNN